MQGSRHLFVHCIYPSGAHSKGRDRQSCLYIGIELDQRHFELLQPIVSGGSVKEQEIAEQCEINMYSYVSVYIFVNTALQNWDEETRQHSFTS